ncbi:YdcF family protein [Rhodococcus fascians]|nr:YdcF family protein [Rhodococcus fascians]MBY3998228.1 YdcF family protein [Rhodococcus fascians]MBY4004386.1 YdcF family protein [Rhodococcus fascians]MBY4009041.1 YdcF family protein [Rhodococcus fascians]MBY4019593.1 YdcF family protein [Rhodococcus fascians]
MFTAWPKQLASVTMACVLIGCVGACASPEALTPTKPGATTTANAGTDSIYEQISALLAEAKEAFDSPARTSSAGNTDKTIDNLQVVVDRLLAAHDLAPYRSDLLFSAASAQIARGDVDAALGLYEQVLANSPHDVDALSYLAGWTRFAGQTALAADYLDRARQQDPQRGAQLDTMFAAIDQAVGTPIDENLPNLDPNGLSIVTLGYALEDDGSMDPILVERLERTKDAAERWPEVPIVVTGGVEKSGRTEGQSMKEWLVDEGVDAARVHDENFARSTVENALYGVQLVAGSRSTHTVIISSASHVRRAETIFDLAADDSLPTDFPFVTLAADTPPAELAVPGTSELRSIYRDAFSVVGLWSYRSAPLLQR